MTAADAIRVVSRLYDARDAAKTILGDRYAAKMDAWRRLVRAVASKHGCDVIQTPMKIEGELGGDSMVFFLAAVVEEIES